MDGKLPVGTIDVIESFMNEGLSKDQAIKKYIEENKAHDLEDLIKKQMENVKEVDVRDFFEDPKNFKGFVPKKLADGIKSRHIFKTTRGDEELFVYQDGVYVSGESLVKEICSRWLKDEVNTHRVSEVINEIKRTTFIDRSEFNKETYLINLKNGIFNLETMELQSHSPDIVMTNQLPVVYNPEIDCPKIKKFCKEIVSKTDVPLLQEMIGYCLWKDYHIQKAFMFVGDGANGKSTYLYLMKHFLGIENVSGVSLQDLCNDRFASSDLFGKLANLHADLPDVALHNTGMFKMLTGGDIISGEKKFKDRFNFINFAKLFFSANKIPETTDFTTAFFRRWIIVNFPNKFEGDDADKKILEKLTTPEELSGLFNWSIEGLKRLLDSGEFTNAITTEEMQEKYQKMSSSVGAFVVDFLEESSSEHIEKHEMYLKYVDYCNENNLPPKASNIFAKELPMYIHVETRHPKIGKKQVAVWSGIKFKDGVNEEKN